MTPHFSIGPIPNTSLCIFPIEPTEVQDITSGTPGIKMAVTESGSVYAIYDAQPHRNKTWFYIASPTDTDQAPAFISEQNLQVLKHCYIHGEDTGMNISHVTNDKITNCKSQQIKTKRPIDSDDRKIDGLTQMSIHHTRTQTQLQSVRTKGDSCFW